MEKKEIIERLKKGKSYKEVGNIAKKLLVKLAPAFNESSLRFDFLTKKHLKKLGYTVFEIGLKSDDAEEFVKMLKKEKFLYTNYVFFNEKKKVVYSISSYPEPLSLLIRDNPSHDKNYHLPKLVSLEDYINLIADDIYREYQDWENYKKNVKNYIYLLLKDFHKEKEFDDEFLFKLTEEITMLVLKDLGYF